ncbi:hypothetical protein EJ06DRAFT_520057 [Trichodelitschia bisporula]|uniref:histone acetyltransferase n=1 Tax=Trichodelitschia bisporula TaxID=703511 RepID=A0A6G1I4R7_9PEZI|nr:hypothetical protein EJ06DRAFT_520057 [Trichodelitschia bisporula]
MAAAMLPSSPPPVSPSLAAALTRELPAGTRLRAYHLSSPPTRCDPLFSPPPGQRGEKTYLESHFLGVTTTSSTTTTPPSPTSPPATSETFILALEVQIYTTTHLTTIFISKADSTGYAPPHPRGASSPLRGIARAFIAHLVRHRRRPHVPLVVSLFARASEQYLFPGSVRNAGKHVSDDRQLIRWWCRVLDPLVASPPTTTTPNFANGSASAVNGSITPAVTAYLLIPGIDSISPFLPPSSRGRWVAGHPLLTLNATPPAPPRCLIPHFPDDPKARFLDELDAELRGSDRGVGDSPSKKGSGAWRSVRSLDQFWDAMACRQECAAGRVVGFLWVVFGVEGEGREGMSSPDAAAARRAPRTPRREVKTKRKRKGVLAGPITPRTPRIKMSDEDAVARRPARSKYYYWPETGRGEIVLVAEKYRKATERLLTGDYGTREQAVIATGQWSAWIYGL